MLKMIIHRFKESREVVELDNLIGPLSAEAFIPVSAEEDLWESLEIYFSGALIRIVAITNGIYVLQLWPIQSGIKLYHYLPDRRINTERLFGKPALGPSPPDRLQNSKAPAGSA